MKLIKYTFPSQTQVRLPVSRFPIITSSPNLAFNQIESAGICPFLSSPRNSHDRVVCNWFTSFGKTDTTSGRSTTTGKNSKQSKIRKYIRLWNEAEGMTISSACHVFVLDNWSTSSSSRVAAKPLIWLVYE